MDTGMPGPVILLSANALALPPVFLLRQRPRFHCVAKNALIALHGKLNKIAQAVACFLLPGDALMLLNGLNILNSLCESSVSTDCVLKQRND
jgi:hypothetical protein